MRLCLGCLNKHLAMLVDKRSQSTSRASSCTILLASAILVASLGPCLGSMIVGPWEQKAQLAELDTHYCSSSFLEV